MADFYCECLRCKLAFTMPNIFGGGFLLGNKTRCPKCGGEARIIDGAYASSGTGETIFQATSHRDQGIVSSLQRAYELARAGKTAEQIISEIEKASPEASIAARSVFARGGIRLLIMFIYLLVAGCDNFKVSATLDINRALDQLHVYATGEKPYPDLGDHLPVPQASPLTSDDETGSIRDGSAQQSEPAKKPQLKREQQRRLRHLANKQKRESDPTAALKPKGGSKR